MRGLGRLASEMQKRKLEDLEGTGPDKIIKLTEEEEGTNYLESDGKSCSHEAVWPKGRLGSKDAPKQIKDSAMEFPFSLDPFQQTSINCLEAGNIC